MFKQLMETQGKRKRAQNDKTRKRKLETRMRQANDTARATEKSEVETGRAKERDPETVVSSQTPDVSETQHGNGKNAAAKEKDGHATAAKQLIRTSNRPRD